MKSVFVRLTLFLAKEFTNAAILSRQHVRGSFWYQGVGWTCRENRQTVGNDQD